MHVSIADAEKAIAAARKKAVKLKTQMCIAVVDLPEPPFSLPITSTCARSSGRAAWFWTIEGLAAG